MYVVCTWVLVWGGWRCLWDPLLSRNSLHLPVSNRFPGWDSSSHKGRLERVQTVAWGDSAYNLLWAAHKNECASLKDNYLLISDLARIIIQMIYSLILNIKRLQVVQTSWYRCISPASVEELRIKTSLSSWAPTAQWESLCLAHTGP